MLLLSSDDSDKLEQLDTALESDKMEPLVLESDKVEVELDRTLERLGIVSFEPKTKLGERFLSSLMGHPQYFS